MTVAKATDTIRSGSEQAIKDVQTTVQREHPAAEATLRPAALGRPIYDPVRFSAINAQLATSARALGRARQAR